MARVDLAALGAKVSLPTHTDAASEPPVVALPSRDELQTMAGPEPTENSPKRPTGAGGAKQPAPGEWVRYDQYERKEARLRPDQYGQLSATSRRLNRTRSGSGERITENTLIRVAIDLLLAREGDIAGTTEAELRRSLGL